MAKALTIIPVLEVCKPCHWCEPQKCWHASVWWGPVLMTFYTTDKDRLEPEKLNEQACDILRELSKAMRPDSEIVITGDDLHAEMKSEILCCIWGDFTPAVAHPVFGYQNKVTIPVPEVAGA